MTDRFDRIEARLSALEAENESLKVQVDELRDLRDYVNDRVDETLRSMRDVRSYQNHVARTMSRMMARALKRVNVIQRDFIDMNKTLNNHDSAVKNLAMAQAALVQNIKGDGESKMMELPPIKPDTRGMN